jgi:predicted TIM-barrel fold metal-dependent hydrolase
MSHFSEIKNYVDSIKVVDTHEHLMEENERLVLGYDPLVVLLPHYLSSDLISSGMELKELNLLRSSDTLLEDRWKSFLDYWVEVENTGYAQAIKIAARDLYGVEEFSVDSWRKLRDSMKNFHKKGLYEHVLKTKSGIDLSINDVSSVEMDGRFNVPVMNFDDYAIATSREDVKQLSIILGEPIHTIEDLLNALKKHYDSVANKIVGVKIGLAYERILSFEKTERAEAEKVFNRIYRTKTFESVEVMPYGSRPLSRNVPSGIDFAEAKPLQDYMVHLIIQLASRYGHPVQIHTGLHEGNENIINHSNPALLVNLFMEYPEVKFDVFHAGYPYFRELATIAKNFPNVYPDLCWIHVVSPKAARSILSEWLDMVPSNKILAFGGDYRFVEGVYGHIKIARRNIVKVLNEKVEEGEIELKQAYTIAKKILRDNALKLFSLNNRQTG